MSERFRFDHRVVVPNPKPGFEVVKFFGDAVQVPAPDASEPRLPSGLTVAQQAELSRRTASIGISVLTAQKRNISQGRLK